MQAQKNPAHKPPTAKAIARAVASSTAIETGQSVKELEQRLQSGHKQFPQLALALRSLQVAEHD